MLESITYALIGGMLIGASMSVLLYSTGKVAGISNIFGGFLSPTKGDTAWRASFIGGLLAGGIFLLILRPEAFSGYAERSWLAIAAGGLLVGFGTRWSNGCTSGHGLCGVSRMAPRSMLATVTFMISGGAMVWFVNHVLGGAV